MPRATLKLVPGVDTNKTPTLNELAISYSNLVRFMPDRSGMGLVQKLGGWTRYIAGGFSAPIRALKAWSDLEYTKYLAIGGEDDVGVQVYRESDASLIDVTPRTITDNVTSSYVTTSTELPSITNGTPVVVATTANLTATYNNGASGVGATLTNSGTLVAISIDGVSLSSGNRVLVKNQTSGLQNGVYTVTTVGSGSVAWVLTRATDFDAWGTGEIEYGALFSVSSGTTNINKTYYCSNSTTVTVGTTAITFVQALGFVTSTGSSSLTFYSPTIPSSASYSFFPTIVNIGNVNLLGPYDITTTGTGYLTFEVPSLLSPISKISAITSGSDRIVTIQFSFPHSFYAGQKIYVNGVSTSSFNGTFTIGTGSTDVTTYTIKYTQTGVSTAATSSGGNVTPFVIFGGLPPEFTTVNGETTITVDLVNHGFSVGDTFNVPVSTTVGGATISGLYTVNKINTANQFEISVDIAATSSTSGYENSGAIRVEHFVSLVSQGQGDNYLYGGGIYGEGVYGSGFVPATDTGTALTAEDWALDNWGSILTACPKNGALYYWQPVGSAIQNLSYMPNAPVYNAGAFVAMPQRQMIAYGSSFGSIQDPLLVRWCDLEDFTTWQATASNQAGSYRIPTGSRIVGGIQASQQALLWTDLDLWSMTYIGQPYIYGFNKIGANAGMIAPKAAGQMGGVVYWMSQKQFFRFAGNGVEVIPCPVWDQVFQNFYPGVDDNGNPYTDRIRCAANSQFNEITWYFPAHYTNNIDPETGLELNEQQIGTGEVNAYVKYNVALNQWDYGYQHPDDAAVLVGRTAWIDQSILGSPIGAAAATSVAGQTTGFYVYQHETSNNADGASMESGFTTGYASLAEGDNLIFIDQVWPDMKWGFVDEAKTANVKITFFVTNYPGDAPVEYGPYTVTQQTEYLSVRMRGRLIAIGVSSTDSGSFWRMGALRYRFQPDGRF
jgi:hypothetical protein